MDTRTFERRKVHYKIEKDIANKLRNSTSEERKVLYSWAYDTLFREVFDHPLLAARTQSERRKLTLKALKNVRPFVNEDTVYLEIGPGDCSVALEIAKQVKRVYAVDVSNEITKNLTLPENFELILSDGTSISVDKESIDFAYSNQLMEHLHIEDSYCQLQNIYKVLKPGGVYYCNTPNRLSGPHDISMYFDPVATGLHLKEYTVTELAELFENTGFTKIKVYLQYIDYSLFVPITFYKFAEMLLDSIPHSLRRIITFNKVARFLLGVKLIGTK